MLILSLFQRKFGDFKIERDGSYRSNSDNLEFWLATVKGERRLGISDIYNNPLFESRIANSGTPISQSDHSTGKK
jgi:hypothetical protein